MRRALVRNVLAGLASLALLGLWTVDQAYAQYLFVDTNGDAASTEADRLSQSGETKLAIWIQTDMDRNGTSPSLGSMGVPLSIFSYSFAILASGGTVEWGRYANAQPSMVYSLGEASSATEFFTGFGGQERLAPGKYKLGTISVRVLTGDPSLEFIPMSSIQNAGYTAFGSMNRGRENDHTLKLAPTSGGGEDANRGDWRDADGVASPSGRGVVHAAGQMRAEARAFGVTVASDKSARIIRFRVTTAMAGPTRVRLFDVSGRLVRAAEAEGATAGEHAIEIPMRSANGRRLGRGVYFYRVDAADGALTGKVAIVQ